MGEWCLNESESEQVNVDSAETRFLRDGPWKFNRG